jgi:hypothetical protein
VGKLTLAPADVDEAVSATGVTPDALRDAVEVCAAFNVIDRIADALDFAPQSKASLAASARDSRLRLSGGAPAVRRSIPSRCRSSPEMPISSIKLVGNIGGGLGYDRSRQGDHQSPREELMVALVVLLLILAIFGGIGFAVHALWIALAILLVLWLLGFVIRGAEGAGRARWYRW